MLPDVQAGTTGMRIFYVVLGLGFCIVGLISFMTGISVLYIIPMIKADPLSVFEIIIRERMKRYEEQKNGWRRH